MVQTRQLIAERSSSGIRDLLFRYVLVPLFVVIGIFGLLKYATTGEGGVHDVNGKSPNTLSAE